jgi:hypothetical protein
VVLVPRPRPTVTRARALRDTPAVTGEQRFWSEVARTCEELATPVEGELRREPIADADAPCPRCGAREWLAIERRAERDEPYTRQAIVACASCGVGIGGWQAAGRARPGRAEDHWDELDHVHGVPGLPDDPTVADVCRLTPFRVFAPSPSPKLRAYGHTAGKLTTVTVESEGVEVTTTIRQPVPGWQPNDHDRERHARWRLRFLFDESPAVLREGRSKPAQRVHMAAAHRRAAARADAAPARRVRIDVDDASVPFELVESDGCWAAVADIGGETVTVAARDVPATPVSLQTVLCD